MRKFGAAEIDPGMTSDQRERTNAAFARMVCMNIDWISYQAQRTPDPNYVSEIVGNYRMFAMNSAHNAAEPRP